MDCVQHGLSDKTHLVNDQHSAVGQRSLQFGQPGSVQVCVLERSLIPADVYLEQTVQGLSTYKVGGGRVGVSSHADNQAVALSIVGILLDCFNHLRLACASLA